MRSALRSRNRLTGIVIAFCIGTIVGPGATAAVTIDFDQFLDGTVVSTQYLPEGILFSSPSPDGAPIAYDFFESPASPPNYLVGENEGQVDLNPETEFGNNELALPITFWFVEPGAPATPAAKNAVSFNLIFTNVGAVTRAEAFDVAGALLSTIDVTGFLGGVSLPVVFMHSGIHRVVVTFGVSGSTSFEDHAGIDDVAFEDGTVGLDSKSWGSIKGLYRAGP